MLEEGLNRMKESMVDFSKQICPSLDCSDLAEANIFLPIRWRHAVKGILSAFFFFLNHCLLSVGAELYDGHYMRVIYCVFLCGPIGTYVL